MGPLRRTLLLWMIGLGLLATATASAGADTLPGQQGVGRALPLAAPSAPVAEPPGALDVLWNLALDLGRNPGLLGGAILMALLIYLCGVGSGHRRAWLRQPSLQPTPALARAMAALQSVEPGAALDVRRARLAVAGGRPLLLSLSYEIKAERRAEFLASMEHLRDHLVRELGYAYAVWEQEGKPNWFTEMILCTSAQEFDRLAGPDDSTTRRLVAQLDQFLRDQAKVQRTSLIGVGLAPAAARASGEPVVRQPDAVLQPDPRSVPIPRPARGVPPGDLAAEAA